MADRSYSVTIGAGGTGTISISPGSGTRQWTVTQVSSELAAAPVGATADLRKNGNYITALIAVGDSAGGDPPVVLWPSDVLTVNWYGCTPGTVGKALIFFTEEKYP